MATPRGITHSHVLKGIRLFDAGESHSFGKSKVYDLLYEGRRYPPKAILGLAAKVASGEIFEPSDFSGGEKSLCFKILRMAGFTIILKKGKGSVAVEIPEAPTPTEEFESEGQIEGGKKTRFTTYYERLPHYRKRALEIHGLSCMACDMNFVERYGPLGVGFIHVHHNKPVSEGEAKPIDPRTDLSVVCPNCHAMIHRKKSETLTVEQVRQLLRENEQIA